MKKNLQRIFYNSLYKSGYSRARFTMFGIVFQELRVNLGQFFTWRNPVISFFRAFLVFQSTILRLLIGRNVKYSFAYTGEDRIIESILKPLIYHKGFYVDVGCNHPKYISNTYALYRKGWRGICIDANKELIKKYRLQRPKDIAINALVSNEVRTKTFYLAENDGLSTTEQSNLKEIEQQNIEVKEVKMVSKTLTSILLEYNAPEHFDVLSIDAEEHDFQILSSLDFGLFRPQLIVLEDELFDLKNPHDNPSYKLLTDKGYACEGYILKNLYFTSKS